ncbi:hypothetical protein M409DRAFT_52688 [Zasmidium cellare ATCC 36951]|uniref:Phosphatidylethanolamine-binding protein n=1 Tax=Zasmidium cellare ATCC 36951 TaxID=1080233 RepID=A0A6A6CUH3_ZASCE|nr:uncharacterized protein M409DRAFT_52688 [Zasmidium cellare ATCC 36951]KAF2169449.1 hypothetical protein M409DRAFT_52688 [Zasmidium cellare ATCC 36951]
MPTNASVDRALAAIAKDESKKLGVIVNGKSITTGQYIPRAEAQTAPQISLPTASPSQKYLLIALDLDAPFQSWRGLGPILHCIQPGLTLSPNNNELTTTDPFIANYIGPAPPPGSGPHRYSFYLFKQPENFDGKKYAPPDGKNLGNMSRMRFDLDAWMSKAGLEDAIAANYFTSS